MTQPNQQPDQKITRGTNHYPTVTVTRAELVSIVRTKYPFRKYLESRGIIHRRGLHVESWSNKEVADGSINFRNYKQKTDVEIATASGGIGIVGRM